MDEEDVLFENTPLHRYLMENEITNEATPRNANFTCLNNTTSRSSILLLTQTKLLRCLKLALNMVLNILDVKTLDCYKENVILNYVISSNLLEEDDENLLKNLTLSDQRSIAPNKFAYFNVVFQLPVLIGFLSIIIIGFRMNIDGTFSFTVHSLYVLIVFVFILWTFRCIWIITKHFVWQRECANLKSFLDLEKKVDAEIRKLLILIRDREIISRGYTIVTQRTPVIDSHVAQHLNEDTLPLIKLRKCVLKCVSELLHDFRSETKTLLTNKTIQWMDIFASNQFIITTLDDNYFNNLFDSSYDSLTLSALKALCRYFNLQRSEFLRLFVLCRCSRLVHSNELTEIIYHHVFERHSVWNVYLLHLHDKSKHALNVLQTTAKLNSARTLLETSNLARNSRLSPLSQHASAAHSLQLHLQVALEKSLNLQNNEGAIEATFVSMLDEIENELKASIICGEEIRTLLRKESHNNVENIPIISSPIQQPANLKTLCIDDSYEPFIADQVFEATVRRTDDSSNGDGLNDAEYSSDNATFPRRNLLDELKSVLSVRSTLMQAREMRALAASRGLSVDDLIKENEAEEDQLKNSVRNIYKKKVFAERSDSPKGNGDAASAFSSSSLLGSTLADELRKALLTRGGKEYEIQIGEVDGDDVDDASSDGFYE